MLVWGDLVAGCSLVKSEQNNPTENCEIVKNDRAHRSQSSLSPGILSALPVHLPLA
jgi:hypothetical protein